MIVASSARIWARSMTFASSRTLPGQAYRTSDSIASGVTCIFRGPSWRVGWMWRWRREASEKLTRSRRPDLLR